MQTLLHHSEKTYQHHHTQRQKSKGMSLLVTPQRRIQAPAPRQGQARAGGKKKRTSTSDEGIEKNGAKHQTGGSVGLIRTVLGSACHDRCKSAKCKKLSAEAPTSGIKPGRIQQSWPKN